MVLTERREGGGGGAHRAGYGILGLGGAFSCVYNYSEPVEPGLKTDCVVCFATGAAV